MSGLLEAELDDKRELQLFHLTFLFANILLQAQLSQNLIIALTPFIKSELVRAFLFCVIVDAKAGGETTSTTYM